MSTCPQQYHNVMHITIVLQYTPCSKNAPSHHTELYILYGWLVGVYSVHQLLQFHMFYWTIHIFNPVIPHKDHNMCFKMSTHPPSNVTQSWKQFCRCLSTEESLVKFASWGDNMLMQLTDRFHQLAALAHVDINLLCKVTDHRSSENSFSP